jgi:pyruvate-formate lyase
LLSRVIDDCIERGLDVTAGGAHYNASGVQGVQVANVADSLAVVWQAVFKERWLDAGDLLDTLRHDYEGYETLRQRLLHRVPKYGNDDDRVDSLARKWADRYSELVARYPTLRGGFTSRVSTPSPLTSPWARPWGRPPTAVAPASRWPTAAFRPRLVRAGEGRQQRCAR